MENRIDAIEKTIELFRGDLGELRKLVIAGYAKADSNFETLSRKIDSLSVGMDNLSVGTDHSFGKVETKLDSLSDEIKKIADVTRYDEQLTNLNTIVGPAKN